jgi:signal transduction histidine kinase
METRSLADLRAERLIASGRLTLAALTLFAIWLDPLEPSRQPPLGYAVGVVYTAYAALLMVVAWTPEPSLLRWRLPTHVVDLVAYTAILYFTSGASSPFFAFLVFALAAAALRWQWTGVLATAAAALVAYVAVGLLASGAHEPGVVLLFVVRATYLVVLAALLGHLGSHYQRLRQEVATLVALPAAPRADPPSVARQLVEHAHEVLRAGETLLVWSADDEGRANTMRRRAEGPVERRQAPLGMDTLVAAPLAQASFLTGDGGSAAAGVLYRDGDRLRRWRGAALAPALAAELPAGPLLGLRLDGRATHGWLLAARRRRFHADDLLLGELLARHAAPQLDGAHESQREQRQAALEERARLARDLHDGAIQSLTGASLRLHAVDRLLEQSPDEARQLLGEIDELLVSEQQELRWFAAEPSGDWADRLEQLSERMARNWGMYVWFANEAIGVLAGDFGHEVYRIVQEGLVNAARHGGARHARVEMDLAGDALHLRVSDDGRGFPFRGELDDAALRDRRLGPVSIKQRVAALGGQIAIRSQETGARLDIRLPLVVTSEPA